MPKKGKYGDKSGLYFVLSLSFYHPVPDHMYAHRRSDGTIENLSKKHLTALPLEGRVLWAPAELIQLETVLEIPFRNYQGPGMYWRKTPQSVPSEVPTHAWPRDGPVPVCPCTCMQYIPLDMCWSWSRKLLFRCSEKSNWIVITFVGTAEKFTCVDLKV